MFENLKKAIEAEAAYRVARYAAYLAGGGNPARNLTATQAEKAAAGKITRAELEALAVRKERRAAEKAAAFALAKLERAEQAAPLELVNISIAWISGPTWGKNPHAKVAAYTRVAGEIAHGRASGCGYDKASAAVAEALNALPAVLRVVYEAEEMRIADGGKRTRREALGYAVCNGGALPAFVGGVGLSSIAEVFRRAGYEWIGTEDDCTAWRRRPQQ